MSIAAWRSWVARKRSAKWVGERLGPGQPGTGKPVGDGRHHGAHLCEPPTLGTDNLRALGRREYEASLRDVFGSAAIDAAASQLAHCRQESTARFFGRWRKGRTGADVESYFMIADALAGYVTSAPDKLSALAPCLAAPTVPSDCAKTFIETFGRRLYRRPLAPMR